MCKRKREGGRCAHHTALAAATKLVPRRTRKLREYYRATEDKHFSKATSSGSRFTDPDIKTLNDLLALAHKQRGNLAGDDREALIAAGAAPDSFRDGIRYLKVETQGTVGITPISSLKDEDTLHVKITKPGLPSSLVLPVAEQPKTSIGTIIIGPDGNGKEILFTAHPGLPIKPSSEEKFEKHIGGTITVKEAKRIVGDGAWVLTEEHKPR